MADEHKHNWKPVPNEFRCYTCNCGKTGFRRSLGEPIREHKKPRDYHRLGQTHISSTALATGANRTGKRGPGGW